MNIAELLLMAKENNASDLHISVGLPPILRIHGIMERTGSSPMEKEETHDLLYDILSDAQKSTLEEKMDIDFSLEVENVGRFRVNIYRDRRGIAAAFRLIPEEIRSVQELGLPDALTHLARRRKGLILVTGPTGSGKSTTLATVIDQINEERKEHIITIEDPIEFIHQHKNCMVNQREIGFHAESFNRALRAALREDPDVILVGEMRDLETIGMAITAAETGHLVLATLHTNSCAETIDRIVDVFPSHQQKQIRTQLANSIQGVLTQTLIPTIDGRGRVVACEVMIGTTAIRSLIREAKPHQIASVIQTSTKEGMQSMDQCLKNLVMERKIALSEAISRADHVDEFRKLEATYGTK
ncbi:type IV pilus twitching motility protein PilT [PVC group bacterium]|nr:type IV pilus twitching motility protein PilT [PVC group bacterium]MCH7589597.1 type IV pilus twitching motility protein PilT [PVC group bacterium]